MEDGISFALYRKLYMARRAEELIIELYPEDEMKTPMHMSMGQEAIAVGVCHALSLQDQVYTSYRSHGAFLAKTGDTDRFFAELHGRQSGTANGKAGSMHLAAPDQGHMCSSAIVGSCIPVALGTAFANKQMGNGSISCVFFGDGALDEGVFWESLNVACVMQLAVLFVCEDNGLAVHTPARVRQGYKGITDIVSKFACNVFQADTTEVEVIYDLAQTAKESVKTTGRPSFVHFKCYRYLEHAGIHEDFNAGYRSKCEFEEWFKRDCVALQRKRLLTLGYAEEEIARREKLVDGQLKESIRHAREAPFPRPEALHEGVFYEKD